MMRRVSIAMFLGGGGMCMIGLWATQQTARSQWLHGVFGAVFFAMAALVAVLPRPSRQLHESFALVSLATIGALIAGAEPLGVAPIFTLWPVVFLAHFSSQRMAACGFASSVAAVGVGLTVNTSAEQRIDVFIGTTVAVGLMCWVVSSLTRRESNLRAELTRIAETDELTGLLDRGALLPRLERLVGDAKSNGDQLSIVMFDLDHFKHVNDEFGRAGGDEVLRCVAAVLQSTAREHDVIARLGGEEFVVVLPGAGLAGGLGFAARAADALQAGPQPFGSIATSAGVCALDETIDCPAELLVRADDALDAAKEAGRGRAGGWTQDGVIDLRFSTQAPIPTRPTDVSVA